jgi:hypothetical protein
VVGGIKGYKVNPVPGENREKNKNCGNGRYQYAGRNEPCPNEIEPKMISDEKPGNK